MADVECESDSCTEGVSSWYACLVTTLLAKDSPYVLSFPNIQRTCIRPNWRDAVTVTSRFLLFRFPFLAIGSAKVRRNFEVTSESENFLFFSASRFSIRGPFRSKRAAKVRSFFRLSQPAAKLFFAVGGEAARAVRHG